MIRTGASTHWNSNNTSCLNREFPVRWIHRFLCSPGSWDWESNPNPNSSDNLPSLIQISSKLATKIICHFDNTIWCRTHLWPRVYIKLVECNQCTYILIEFLKFPTYRTSREICYQDPQFSYIKFPITNLPEFSLIASFISEKNTCVYIYVCVCPCISISEQVLRWNNCIALLHLSCIITAWTNCPISSLFKEMETPAIGFCHTERDRSIRPHGTHSFLLDVTESSMLIRLVLVPLSHRSRWVVGGRERRGSVGSVSRTPLHRRRRRRRRVGGVNLEEEVVPGEEVAEVALALLQPPRHFPDGRGHHPRLPPQEPPQPGEPQPQPPPDGHPPQPGPDPRWRPGQDVVSEPDLVVGLVVIASDIEARFGFQLLVLEEGSHGWGFWIRRDNQKLREWGEDEEKEWSSENPGME